MPALDVHITRTPTRHLIQTIENGARQTAQRAVSSLPQMTDTTFALVLRDARGTLLGGVYCEFDWGYLFVDTLWVAEEARGRGHGRLLMISAEQVALAQGIRRAYLFTVDFQAQPFYHKLGYRTFGTIADRPPQHTCYYLHKPLTSRTVAVPDHLHIERQSPPTPDDLRRLEYGLLSHALQHVPIDNRRLAITLQHEQEIRAGVFGGVFWSWFDMRYVWVHPDEDQSARLAQLLTIASRTSHDEGAIGIVCDIGDFDALASYQAAGFRTFGTLQRPPDHTSYFLHKRL
jgi:GNAT superfamily N-acetyltransferase